LLTINRQFYLFAVLSVFAEITIFSYLQLFGVRPNITLFIICVYCFYFSYDVIKVFLFALFCGVLTDALSAVAPGTYMCLYPLIAVSLAHISKNISRFNWHFVIVLFVFATLISGVLYCGLQYFCYERPIAFFAFFWRIVFLELLYGLALIGVSLKLIQRYIVAKLL